MIKLLILFVCATFAQINNEDDGQYHPDDEGQYIEDNSGQYIPDYSGLYHDDGTGRYNQDNSGQYAHTQERNDVYRFKNYASTPSASYVKNVKKQVVQPKSNDINVPVPVKYGKFDDNRWKIIKLYSDVKNDGFHWEYETENEISGQENAKIVNRGTKDEAIRTKGFYQYTGADNKVYNVEYTADENGFIPRGNHLHPILQKAILLNLNNKRENAK